MRLIGHETYAGEDRPNRCFAFRTLHGHDRLVGEGRHHIGDVGNQRTTRDLDEGLGASESAGLASREDECRVHGDQMLLLLEKPREGKISRSGLGRIVAPGR